MDQIWVKLTLVSKHNIMYTDAILIKYNITFHRIRILICV